MGANGEQDTIEEIEDNLFWLGGEDSVTPSEVVAETIAKLPSDIRQWAPDALHWFCPPSVGCALRASRGGMNDSTPSGYCCL